MATYVELHDLASSGTLSDLRKKLRVAITIKANAIAESATPTAAAKAWALQALGNPQSFEQTVLNYVLADNATATTTAIANATDTMVQTAVDAAVNTLLGA